MEVAKQYSKDYWDGDRKYGYGGYKYDGRWKPVAEAMVKEYGLESDDIILDIGCGKGFLLYDFTQIFIAPDIYGIDASTYAICDAEHHFIKYEYPDSWFAVSPATNLPFTKDSFDFVYSINVFHNLTAPDLKKSIQEMMRVSKADARRYICVESYRNEQEKFNLQCWALTCEQFHSPDDWKWLLNEYGYSGDMEFVYFT